MYIKFFLTVFLLIFLGFLFLDKEEGNVKRGLGYGLFLSLIFSLAGYLGEVVFHIF
jgi:hypothetical protein